MNGLQLVVTVIIMIFIIIPPLAQLLMRLGQARQQPGQGPNRGAPMPRRADPLRDEVEEFLRRMAGAQGAPKGDKPEGSPPRGRKRGSGRRAQTAPAAPAKKPVEVESASYRQALGADVKEHVQTYLNTQDISRHASGLGEDVAEADDRIEHRLQSVFDHQLGQLDPNAAASQPGAPATAVAGDMRSDLVGLLSQPKSLQQAVLLSEILQRPEHRWGGEGLRS